MTLRSLLLRIHAGWIHLLNIEASDDSADSQESGRGPGAFSVSSSTGHEPPKTHLDAIGGQAVVEGVLMRAPGRIAIAARAPDGTIALQARDFTPFAKRHPILALPILRGAASLIEALYIGTKALNWSAGVQENKPAHEELAEPSSLGAKALAAGTLVISFALALGLFQLLPYGVASLLVGGSPSHPQNPVLFNATAGAVRITLLIAYLYGLSFLPDIRRLFQYHGAEHKSIFSHESGDGLTADAVARQIRFHPRCGTSFILIVALTCILFFSILDAFMLHVVGWAYPNFLVRFLVHLPFVPFVAGLSFEFLKASAKHQESKWIRPLILPGLWLQRITTREPDEKQIEVAIVSAKAAIG